ncbi:hypothetical protein DBV15_02380 [Temnothorax longispinosus]|uniref:Uncharacterized protein n=1 Tax=Temnothorax longispinosus TaxID=300112 RepID=A0A4S2JWM6_9HYME|nr:hypothetical protein DBV15_02380 [Temnothorax longispinosus]
MAPTPAYARGTEPPSARSRAATRRRCPGLTDGRRLEVEGGGEGGGWLGEEKAKGPLLFESKASAGTLMPLTALGLRPPRYVRPRTYKISAPRLFATKYKGERQLRIKLSLLETYNCITMVFLSSMLSSRSVDSVGLHFSTVNNTPSLSTPNNAGVENRKIERHIRQLVLNEGRAAGRLGTSLDGAAVIQAGRTGRSSRFASVALAAVRRAESVLNASCDGQQRRVVVVVVVSQRRPGTVRAITRRLPALLSARVNRAAVLRTERRRRRRSSPATHRAHRARDGAPIDARCWALLARASACQPSLHARVNRAPPELPLIVAAITRWELGTEGGDERRVVCVAVPGAWCLVPEREDTWTTGRDATLSLLFSVRQARLLRAPSPRVSVVAVKLGPPRRPGSRHVVGSVVARDPGFEREVSANELTSTLTLTFNVASRRGAARQGRLIHVTKDDATVTGDRRRGCGFSSVLSTRTDTGSAGSLLSRAWHTHLCCASGAGDLAARSGAERRLRCQETLARRGETERRGTAHVGIDRNRKRSPSVDSA